MNICHVNLASGFSGGERQTLLLIEHQISQGLRPTVVANPKSTFYRAAQELGCDVLLTNHFLLGHGVTAKRVAAKRGAPKKTFDVLHVHEGKAVYWAFIHSLLTGAPYIITRRIDNPLKRKTMLMRAYTKASRVVGLSAAIKQEINKTLPGISVDIIPSSPVTYPVNTNSVQQIKARFEDKIIVLQAGKLLKHKGFDVTLECAKILQETHPNIHFCLLGDGPEKAHLVSNSQQLSNVSLEGNQSNMGDWFAAADMIIHPSFNEGLGSVILEAMHAGLPAIGTRVGGIPDIIQHRVNGLLIDPNNPNQLAQAVLELVSSKDGYLSHLKPSLERFNMLTCAEHYQALYRAI